MYFCIFCVLYTFKLHLFHQNSLQQLTALVILRIVNHLLKDPAEVHREPAEGKDKDEAENGSGHLPPLQREATGVNPPLNKTWLRLCNWQTEPIQFDSVKKHSEDKLQFKNNR